MPLRPNPNRRPVQNALFPVPPVTVRAPSFLLIVERCRCWKCGQDTDIHAVGVAPPFTRLASFDAWHEGQVLAVFSYIEWVPDVIAELLAQRVPRFFRDESKWHQRPYWMNHCEHCGAKIGDYESIDSPSAPFNPTKIEVSKLRLSVISESFEAAAILNPCPGATLPAA